MTRLMLTLCLPLLAASTLCTEAQAQERVLLQEIMPELVGSPLGELDIAPAPTLGSTLVVRKSEVLRALAQAGVSAKDLNIPRATRITRAIDDVSSEKLSAEAHEALTSATAPCELRDARFPPGVRLATGPREFHAEFTNGLRNGSISGAVVVENGGRSTRVPVMVRLVCPPPEVKAGMQVTAIAVIGHVSASAPAEARQPGRVGEVIRITNRATGANLRARVVDARTVEVLP
jgi:hypothetical protein